MVYSIDSMHFNYLLPRFDQMYIAAHRWKEEILSFPTMYHTSKCVTCFKLKGYDRSSTCEQKGAK